MATVKGAYLGIKAAERRRKIAMDDVYAPVAAARAPAPAPSRSAVGTADTKQIIARQEAEGLDEGLVRTKRKKR